MSNEVAPGREGESEVTEPEFPFPGDRRRMDDVASDELILLAAATLAAALISTHRIAPENAPSVLREMRDLVMDMVDSSFVDPPEQDALPGVGTDQLPAVKIEDSVTDDYLVCLEDGMRFKSLKRHLRTCHGMSPVEYRRKWGLRGDYPITAPAYSRYRGQMAREAGLGSGKPRGKSIKSGKTGSGTGKK